ncbi:MAG: hypothetical protein ACI8YQ_004788 [Polaribacter sp.]|jgi:hypothetical protein
MLVNKKHDRVIKVVLTLFLITLSTAIHSQSNTIVGNIKSDEGNPISEVLIFTNDSIFTLSDVDGNFILPNLSGDSLLVHFKSLAFSDLDTVVYFKESKEVILDIELRRKLYDLGEVVISDSKENLFDKENWTILDYLAKDNLIFILSLENPKRSLHSFSSEGYFIDRLELKEKYNELFLSCTGGLHMLGKRNCAEFKNEKDALTIFKIYERSVFESTLETCLDQFENQFIFKSYANHNKRINYFFYLDQQAELLAGVWDKNAQKVAESYRREIIGMYLGNLDGKNKNAIDSGITKDNIIADGSWNGDLRALINSRELVKKVAYFRNVVASPVRSAEIRTKEEYFIIDFVQSLAKSICCDPLQTTSTLPLHGEIWKDKKLEVFQDGTQNISFLKNRKDEIYEVYLERDKLKAKFISILPQQSNFARMHSINNGVCYFVDNVFGVDLLKTKLHKFNLAALKP